ncbi:DNA-directed primase/polymerase protein [Rattus rattus]|uniref:DNA-directed primase/polymerase protein n=1 Tax=Rattus rattus TaxID=10117 RepID=UPI0013F3824C|nr:DNA-directed primase/polymerase protein [Rattus rattus]
MMGKWESMVKQIEERASYYERKPLSSVYRPRLSKPEEPSSIWKIFHRQNQAFNFVKSCKESVHVFALEHKMGNGQRIYLVTSYAQFWFYYKTRTTLLHCYEVIPENAVCKLYFDLEFNKLANPGADGKEMVALLVQHVCEALQEIYSVHCSAEDVLNLDSSTEEKFSRHLIFQLHDVAFKDNTHVGNFVRKILQPALHLITKDDEDEIPEAVGHEASCFSVTPLKQEISEAWEKLRLPKQCDPDLSFLVVKNHIGEKCLFVDLGVYTKNRNFRLYQSSKIGKRVSLEVAEDNRFIPKQSKDISEENQYFLSSLVSNVRFSDTLRILSCDPSQTKRKRVEYFNSAGTSVEPIEGFQGSPYPEVDRFVLSLVNKPDTEGGIRRWNYFFPEELLVYDICKYRWCENIGRAHKSNNIMILVDLKNEVWYQKCHDPVCKAQNFKSTCFPLPTEVSLLFLLKDEEDFTSGETDEDSNSLTKNFQNPPPCNLSAADWDDGDDACFLEATEDAEFADAADKSVLGSVDDIPDELIIEALQSS